VKLFVKVDPRQKKFIIIGLGVIAVLVLVYALTLKQEGGEELNVTVESKKETLVAYREKLDLRGVYESRIQLYNARLQQDRARFLQGETANVAEANLLNTLTDLAQKSGVQITQKGPRPERKIENKVIKVSYRITTSCTIDQFVQLLTEIANYEQFLTIDDLSVGSPNRGRSRPQQATANLTPILTVSGYIPSIEAETDAATNL
jgi:Tfp pilus assembly protein PilO